MRFVVRAPGYHQLIALDPDRLASTYLPATEKCMTKAGVTLAEVAAHLQVAEETIHRWIRSKPVVALPLLSPATPAAAVPIAPPAAATRQPPALPRYIEDPVVASVALLNRERRCYGSNIRKAHARGWKPHHVLHRMADVYHGYRHEKVTKPGALLAKILTEHHPKQYEQPPELMWEWLKTTGYPALPVFAAADH